MIYKNTRTSVANVVMDHIVATQAIIAVVILDNLEVHCQLARPTLFIVVQIDLTETR
jgi:hypothetical protein